MKKWFNIFSVALVVLFVWSTVLMGGIIGNSTFFFGWLQTAGQGFPIWFITLVQYLSIANIFITIILNGILVFSGLKMLSCLVKKYSDQ